MENVHKGHRQRLKKQFLEQGLASLHEHQILELLLFYTRPHVDTNEIAHSLLIKYGSISKVLNAPFSELAEIKGVGENSATLIKLIPQLLSFYKTQQNSEVAMTSSKLLCTYFEHRFLGETKECLRVCCLDDNLNIVLCEEVAKGDISVVPISARRILETAFSSNCSLVVLAHNHPKGSSIASDADIRVTRHLKRILSDVGLTLIDHIIVGANDVSSMKNNGYFTLLD